MVIYHLIVAKSALSTVVCALTCTQRNNADLISTVLKLFIRVYTSCAENGSVSAIENVIVAWLSTPDFSDFRRTKALILVDNVGLNALEQAGIVVSKWCRSTEGELPPFPLLAFVSLRLNLAISVIMDALFSGNLSNDDVVSTLKLLLHIRSFDAYNQLHVDVDLMRSLADSRPNNLSYMVSLLRLYGSLEMNDNTSFVLSRWIDSTAGM